MENSPAGFSGEKQNGAGTSQGYANDLRNILPSLRFDKIRREGRLRGLRYAATLRYDATLREAKKSR